jgi:ketosteroid isomerase-like protein
MIGRSVRSQVCRIRGGKIVLFRVYFNVGGLQDILAA